MPSNLDLPSIIPSDARVPLNVSALLHMLQNRQDEFAIRLSDVLRQLQYATQIIWNTLKQSFPEFETFELLGTDGNPLVSIAYENIRISSATTTAQLNLGPNSIVIAEGTDQLDGSVGGDSVALNLTRNGNTDIAIQTTPGGVVISLATGAKIMFNGIQVLTDQQATVNAVSATAGATYTATEQAMINDLKAKVNDIRARLQSHGLIA